MSEKQETEKVVMRCEVCAAFAPKMGKNWGVCRRYPPVYVPGLFGKGRWLQPVVHKSLVCKEFFGWDEVNIATEEMMESQIGKAMNEEYTRRYE
jgi:hypothetical protein